jgi:hypothetical protein
VLAAERLMESKLIDVNIRDSFDTTVLWMALSMQNHVMVSYLVQVGAHYWEELIEYYIKLHA